MMASPLLSRGKEDMIGPKGMIRREEFVKVITEALYSLGFERSGEILEEESRIPLYSPEENLFRKLFLDGNWDESLSVLHRICPVDGYSLKRASFLILEQKFIELLHKDQTMDALNTLRREITPLEFNEKRVHNLACYLVAPLQNVLPSFPNFETATYKTKLKILETLKDFLPKTVMIPERRLEDLVEQALAAQKSFCHLRKCLDSSLSLYTDHDCEGLLPFFTVQILERHDGQVWFLRFSNHGGYLASSSDDNSAIIWEVHEDGVVTFKHKLIGHQKAVSMVAWSPDDSQLLTSGVEEGVRRWDVNTGQCLHVYEKPGVGLTSCCWFPDGERLVSGVTDGSICIWDLDGNELDSWEVGQKKCFVSDVLVTSDGRVISLYDDKVIRLLDHDREERLIEEQESITSFTLSENNDYLLVNLANQEIHLWNIQRDPVKLKSYRGFKRSGFVIRSCFGGLNQLYIASGSENSKVYVWDRRSGATLAILDGHSGVVICVSWHPYNPYLFASAGVDHTIRIWGTLRRDPLVM